MKRKFCLNKSRKIRIIGGKWKGRKITVVSDLFLRPTMNRIRETLFNWLNFKIIQHAVCLDCFAGTGSLGLEALSRGASKVTFIDNNSVFISELIKNTKFLCRDHIKIIKSDCCRWLKQSKETYDLIFLDPPFHSQIIFQVIQLLEVFNHFKKRSWIYIESPNGSLDTSYIQFLSKWILYRQKTTRVVKYALYLREFK